MDKSALHRFLESSGKVNTGKATEIAEVFEECSFDKNERFVKEGKVSNGYFVLAEGFMRSFVTDVDGNDVTIAFYAPVQPVFEVASFFNHIPSKENIEAILPCKGWLINYEQLNHLFHSIPEFREFGRWVLVKGFTAFKLRTLSMITETAEQRYAALMQSHPEVFQFAPLKYIASYLGITDTSLSRIRKEFAKRNHLSA
jgi:CRP-like cAMP-binding protein